MNRRDFVRTLGMAGGLTVLPWNGSRAGDSADAGPRTRPPDAPSLGSDPGVAAAAWAEFVDALRVADRAFLDPERGHFDEYELAYAYRNLSHMLAFAIQLYMYGDPDAPTFLPVQDAPFEKTLGGSPDVSYAFAPVRGDRRYRISGRRGDEAYLSFTLHRGLRGSGFEQFFDSHLNHHDLVTDADGRFEILVAPHGKGPNWLRSSSDATEVYARIYRFDRDRDRPAHFRIEPLDSPVPRRLDRETVAERLRSMTRILRDFGIAIPQPLVDPNRTGELWQLESTGKSRMWTALDNVYSRGVFELEPDQALVIEGEVVPCDYWGIQLWNPFLGSGDYRLGPVSINSRQARLGERGRFRVAIARSDPRIPGLDWISSAGERRGTFFIRWMCARRKPSMPECRIASLDSLRASI